MRRKKKILLINRVYPPFKGATGRVLRDLAQGFVRAGWDVSILSTGLKNTKFFDGNITIYTAKTKARPRSAWAYVGVWLQLYMKSLFLPKHDLVVSMTDPPLSVVLGRMIAAKQKARHIHWCQDLYPDLIKVLGVKMPDFIYNAFDRMMLSALKSCDKIIVIGRCMIKRLQAKGIAAGAMTYLPNWPDHELNDGEKTAPKHLASLNKTPPHNARSEDEQIKEDLRFRVLYAGNIGMVHPIRPVLEAAMILNEAQSDIEFVFVGGGKMFDVLAQKRAEKGLTNLRLIPYQPASRLLDIMQSGDVHLVTMKAEAKGMIVPSKIYAAIAAQRPVVFVGPEKSEPDLMIAQDGFGVRVDADDGKALAKALLKYRNDADAWFNAHEAAVKASEVFVPQHAIDAWVKRADSIVNEGNI